MFSGGSTNQTQVYTYEGIINLPYARNDWTITAAMGNRNGSNNNCNIFQMITQFVFKLLLIIQVQWDVIILQHGIIILPGYLCVNSNTNYSTAATDIDGDSLVYNLV